LINLSIKSSKNGGESGILIHDT